MKYNPTVTIPAPIKSNAALGWLVDTATNALIKAISEGAYWKSLFDIDLVGEMKAYCAPFNADPSFPASDVTTSSNRYREHLEGFCHCCALWHTRRRRKAEDGRTSCYHGIRLRGVSCTTRIRGVIPPKQTFFFHCHR